MANISESRVWLITGASSGLGLALVEAVLAKGERAVATVRNPTALADLQAKYPDTQLLVVTLDVTNAEQIAETFKTVETHFHRLDVVVNNAGYGLSGEIEAVPDDKARHQIETLFWGPVNITKQAIPFFRDVNPKGHGGRILNVTSVGGYSGNQTLAYYSAGKFALEGFTESFTKEMRPEWNIKGIIIEPGGFATKWATSGMVVVPQPPAYEGDSPSNKFRAMAKGAGAIGDVAKAAQAMILIAGEPDPPLRLQLGTDSWGIVQYKANATLKDQEKWATVSHGTNLDGYGPEILEKLKVILGG
ncbi:NAD(P)-binding protein [Artomyces pyxidatus]|uniref:NAD(P)-binding protein n=1 Tax=Artomyces pyxidatus TaxID=48021 RepID=A0ACB8SK47_9AGAM|nr:NAD(P)-binding protein [Artomyces pyxidatus]